MTTATLFRASASPSFALYTLALHAWTVMIAFCDAGERGASVAALTPLKS